MAPLVIIVVFLQMRESLGPFRPRYLCILGGKGSPRSLVQKLDADPNVQELSFTLQTLHLLIPKARPYSFF